MALFFLPCHVSNLLTALLPDGLLKPVFVMLKEGLNHIVPILQSRQRDQSVWSALISLTQAKKLLMEAFLNWLKPKQIGTRS